MHEIERKGGDIERRPAYEIEPVSWQDVKRVMRQRYNLEMPIETSKRMALRSGDAIDEIQEHINERLHPLKSMVLNSFGFGAAQLISEYMDGLQ